MNYRNLFYVLAAGLWAQPNPRMLYVSDSITIKDNTELYVQKTQMILHNHPTRTFTLTTAQTANSQLYLDAFSTITGGSDKHYVDGYIETHRDERIYPLGQKKDNGVRIYAPCQTQSNGKRIRATYRRQNPSNISPNKAANIPLMSSKEYWRIHSRNNNATSKIGLSYDLNLKRSDGMDGGCGLTIVGLNKTNNTWEIIPSEMDGTSFLGNPSTTSSGTISSTANVNLTQYEYFTLGSLSRLEDPIIRITSLSCGTQNTVQITNYNPSLAYDMASGLTIDSQGFITGMDVGTLYTITASNTQCQSNPVTALIPTPVPLVIQATSNSCPGIVVVNVLSGTAPFAFSMDDINFQSSGVFGNVENSPQYFFVKDAAGCSANALATVTLANVANYFSPNGDGINDVWRPSGFEQCSIQKGYIFNRFGQIIHSFTNEDAYWDGRGPEGNAASADAYWYGIEVNNPELGKIEYKGSIQLKLK